MRRPTIGSRATIASLALCLGAALAVPMVAVPGAGAQQPPTDPPASTSSPDGGKDRLSWALAGLADAPAARSSEPASAATTQATLAERSLPTTGAGAIMVRSDGGVVVNVSVAAADDATVAAIEAAGATIGTVSVEYRTVTVTVAVANLRSLADAPGVLAVVEVPTPQTSSNADPATADPATPAPTTNAVNCATNPTGIKSEGDAQLSAATARAASSVNGAGVKIGVISDTYDKVSSPTSAASDVAAAELPGATNPCGNTTNVQVINAGPTSGGSDEGRAMAQIVHDLAPGSPLAFSSAFTSDTDFAQQIRNLQSTGSKVIVDDVSYYNEPFYQDGPIAKAVDDVTAAGVTYFSSAGNSTPQWVPDGGSYEAMSFRSTACPAALLGNGYNGCHDYDAGAGVDNGNLMAIPANAILRTTLGWNEPMYGVTTDLDYFLIDGSNGSVLAASSSANSATGSPVEVIAWQNTYGLTKNVSLVVARFGESATGTPRLKTIVHRNPATSVEWRGGTVQGTDVAGPTVFGHNAMLAAGSIAAVPYYDANTIEDFSSRGPATYCWQPVNGLVPSPAMSCQTKNLDVAATDGVSNSFFGSGGSPWRFYGTSASAPHAAAIAALQVQKEPCRTPAQILAAQRASGVAFGGFTIKDYGSGRVTATTAITGLAPCNPPTKPGAPTGVTAVAGNTQATVTWVAPASAGSSPITSYTVTSSPSSKTCTTGGSLTCTVAGLTNGTPYTFTVKATNAVGTGPASAPSAPVTPSTTTAPGAPRNVSAVAAKQRASVSWAAPTSNGGSAVTGYTVTSSPGAKVCTTSGTLSCTVSGLTAGTSYTFSVKATNAIGTGPASAASNAVVPWDGSGFHPVTPARILDSRQPDNGFSGKVVYPGSKSLQVTGRGGASNVPANATAVVMNVTVADATAESFLTVYPTGTPKPNASNLNFGAGQIIPNLVTVKLGTGGKVEFANAAGGTNVIADVVGYYDDGTTPGDLFTGITPVRLLDSRTSNGGWNSPLPAGPGRDLVVRKPGNGLGVPATATAVVANVTVTGGTAQSFVSVWPSGEVQPGVSNLNLLPGQTIPNLVTVKIGTNGAIKIANQAGSVDVILDVVGYFDPTSGSRFHALAPNRILDTRTNKGLSGPQGQGIQRALNVAGAAGTNVPAGATGLVANVTVADGTAESFVSVYPGNVPRPNPFSNLNFGPNQVIPNLTAVGIAPNGTVNFYNHVGSTALIADAVGYYAAT